MVMRQMNYFANVILKGALAKEEINGHFIQIIQTYEQKDALTSEKKIGKILDALPWKEERGIFHIRDS